MTDEEVRRAAEAMVPAAMSEVFYSASLGPLGRIQIVLPQQPDDGLFDEEWERVFQLVEWVARRRKRDRRKRIHAALELIAPSLAQVDTHPKGGDSSEAPAPLGSAVGQQADAPNPSPDSPHNKGEE